MPEPVLATPRISHIGIAVSDLARSSKFYRDGFGFVDGVQVQVVNEHNALFGIEGSIEMQSRFLRLKDTIIELVEFSIPSAVISPAMRPLFHTGLTHLSFRVEDVQVMASHLERLGGKRQLDTITKDTNGGRSGQIIFCTDPDGTRIELMSYRPDFDFA